MTHQPYPPHQPYGVPPQQPRKKAKWPWLIPVGIVALCGFGGCVAIVGNSGSDSDTTSSSAGPIEAAAGAAADSETAPAGSAVRDGKFEFVVTEVETGLKTVGTNPYLQKEAQGQYVLVHTTVTNTGDRPQSYFGTNQTLIDSQGREFTNDTMAEVNVNDSAIVGADINPGNKMAVVIAFDIPADAQPAAIEFHDSMFSGGVEVALR
ncbi:DUF4352 domain-containing protein [Nocardia jinanensis]|uniref:Mpr protein n=1 Tax=Nocardia jinanensis TaxID=382504 RepID=A0A917RV18_9NOCA|nr:DUF4352 domain-containing protein [Nocardia jinanensis]GGL37685.1 Mpr protein [Nocardia jinanensis]